MRVRILRFGFFSLMTLCVYEVLQYSCGVAIPFVCDVCEPRRPDVLRSSYAPLSSLGCALSDYSTLLKRETK